MNRRAFTALGVAGLVSPQFVLAQSAKRVWRIGYLTALSAATSNAWFPAFREGLRSLGYIEGRDVIIDERYSAGDYQKLAALAAELVALKPDVFLTYGAEATLAADKAGRTIPVVFANIQDPVASGVVSGLARPGGNVTGLSDSHAASVTKRLELIRETLPAASRVAILWRPGNKSHPLQLKDLQVAGTALGLTVLSHPVRNAEEVNRAFAAMKDERAVAVQLLGDAFLTASQRQIAQLAIKHRIAAVYTIRPFAEAGGLIAYGADFRDLFRRAASHVDKILKGAKPADLPVEQSTKFELVINLRTAKALGITVPRAVVLRADHVIE
jgi:putative ABC transport system substrate-binding protein